LVQKLSEIWNQQAFIDNRGGAAGNIGLEAVAKSKPDGYTLVMGNSGTLAVNPSLYAQLTGLRLLSAFQPAQVSLAKNSVLRN
jgi:tripartite-type tricarboxylate transporter receptor subunit TctC